LNIGVNAVEWVKINEEERANKTDWLVKHGSWMALANWQGAKEV
jgi:hypothetical protein